MRTDTAAIESSDAGASSIGSQIPALVIRPTKGWSTIPLRELWDYRELVWFLTWREIKGRYRQMALGPLWIVIRPLSNMVIFSLIFGALAKLPSDGIPYPVFTYVAILPWTFFSVAADKSVASLVTNMGLISKVYFPRLVTPTAVVVAGLADLAIAFVILIGMMAYFGYAPSLATLTLPLYILLAGATALAVGLWTAALAVRFRDMQFATTYGLQFWMYLTPVAYASSLIPERWQLLYQLNPMYWVVEGFRWSLLGTAKGPEPLMLASIGFVVVLLVSGALVFRRTERNVVDLL